eukprot:TCONS_00036679-protein
MSGDWFQNVNGELRAKFQEHQISEKNLIETLCLHDNRIELLKMMNFTVRQILLFEQLRNRIVGDCKINTQQQQLTPSTQRFQRGRKNLLQRELREAAANRWPLESTPPKFDSDKSKDELTNFVQKIAKKQTFSDMGENAIRKKLVGIFQQRRRVKRPSQLNYESATAQKKPRGQ